MESYQWMKLPDFKMIVMFVCLYRITAAVRVVKCNPNDFMFSFLLTVIVLYLVYSVGGVYSYNFQLIYSISFTSVANVTSTPPICRYS